MLRALRFEERDRGLVGFEEKLAAEIEREADIVGVDAVARKHPPHVDSTECGEQFGGRLAVHVVNTLSLECRLQFVIARSESDEAIQSSLWPLDCFASLAMTERSTGELGGGERHR